MDNYKGYSFYVNKNRMFDIKKIVGFSFCLVVLWLNTAKMAIKCHFDEFFDI